MMLSHPDCGCQPKAVIYLLSVSVLAHDLRSQVRSQSKTRHWDQFLRHVYGLSLYLKYGQEHHLTVHEADCAFMHGLIFPLLLFVPCLALC